MKKLLKLSKANKLLFKIINGGGRILPLILLIFLFSACGIAVPYYLNPPTYIGVNLSFNNAYINDPNYAIGYDFYYRIYDENIINTNSVINEAKTFFTEIKLLGLMDNNRSLFDDSYYRRILPVSNNLSTDYPLIPISSIIMPVDPNYFDKTNSANGFDINFTISSEPATEGEGKIRTTSYSPSGSYSTEINFQRYVTEFSNGNDFIAIPFNNIDPINHDDVPELETDANTINIAFFVVLYGRTPDFVPIFSDVIYFGSITNLNI